jgi:hypothetical protein
MISNFALIGEFREFGEFGALGNDCPNFDLCFSAGCERFFLGLFSSCPSYNIISEEL